MLWLWLGREQRGHGLPWRGLRHWTHFFAILELSVEHSWHFLEEERLPLYMVLVRTPLSSILDCIEEEEKMEEEEKEEEEEEEKFQQQMIHV